MKTELQLMTIKSGRPWYCITALIMTLAKVETLIVTLTSF